MTDTQYKYVQEDIQTSQGTEGTVLIPRRILGTLIDEASKILLPRELASRYVGPGEIPGSSLDVNLYTEYAMNVKQIGEGADINKETPEYTSFNIKPDKYGLRIEITKEMEEDSQFALLSGGLMLAARRFAENENSIIISQSLDSAANTVSGGAAVTLANISRAVQYLEDNDKVATDYVVGNEVANDIRLIDTFVEADKAGTDALLRRGEIGGIYGMRTWRVSTNAGMTTTSSYVLDRAHSFMIVEKRPITVETYAQPWADKKGVALTQRIRTRAVRTTATAKITSS